jgi:hypothetical protein
MPLFMKRRTLKISVDLIPQSPDPDSGTLRSLKKERTSSRARILLLQGAYSFAVVGEAEDTVVRSRGRIIPPASKFLWAS